jgi:hypothetical protein
MQVGQRSICPASDCSACKDVRQTWHGKTIIDWPGCDGNCSEVICHWVMCRVVVQGDVRERDGGGRSFGKECFSIASFVPNTIAGSNM